MKKIHILNLAIDNISMTDLLEKLEVNGGLVFTPNVDHLVKIQTDREFYEAYSYADYKVCDSKILMYLAKFLGTPLREKLSGSDLFPAFYRYNRANENVKIFLLGAAEGVADKAAQKINKKVGRQIIVDLYSPSFGFENNQQESDYIIERINQSKATVLAMGVGSPKQEKWLVHYRDRLENIKVLLGIGATIDFEAGNVTRCPKWMSDVGLEWFYRLASEPKRLWKRYLKDDTKIFWLILLQKFGLYRNPFQGNNQQHIPKMKSHKMIGQLLENAGLISDEQVKQILAEQSEKKELRFGELLVMRGWLKPETVTFFVEQLPVLSSNPHKMPLGQYLKEAGLLDEGQINTLLKEQNQQGLRFGELAVKKGWIKPQTLDLLLQYLGVYSMNTATICVVSKAHYSSWVTTAVQ